jgi:hypothetical protein
MNARTFFLIGCLVLALSARVAAETSAAVQLQTLRIHVSASAEPVVAVPAGKYPDQRLTTPVPAIPMTPGLAAGLLGAAIVASVIDKADDSSAKKAADEWRFDLAPIFDVVPEFDFAGQIGSDLGRELRAVAGSRFSRIELGQHVNPGNYERIAAAARSDAVLFVDVRHAIAAKGFAGGATYMARADFALVARTGEVLVADAVEFIAPHSADPSPEARIAWWAGEGRYLATLQRTSAGIAKAVAWRLYGSSGKLTTGRLHAVDDFLKCDDFYKRSVAATSFAISRQSLAGPLQVGIVCDAALAK